MTDTKIQPKLSSMAVPTAEDQRIFDALSDDEKRTLVQAEMEKGLDCPASKISAADTIARVDARRAQIASKTNVDG